MSEFQVISAGKQARWDDIVKSFPNWDVYYLHAYMQAMADHGDGEQLLLYFRGETGRMCCSVHKRDIAQVKVFEGAFPADTYYDLTTPYGYGGPLTDGNFNEEEQKAFLQHFMSYCKENGIVTLFVKFHPLLQNQQAFTALGEVEEIKYTIMMDTRDRQQIMANMDPKNRNVIRKAQKSGCEVFADNGENLDTFISIYEKTMDRLEARPYYYFSRQYYERLLADMGENTCIFYCKKDGVIISSAMFFYNDQYMHYHLSGTLPEYRQYAPTNLMLYEAALWANEHGMSQLHLGGGVGVSDSLFSFKKQFNRNGYLPFYIGRIITNPDAYEKLLDIRCERNPQFSRENEMFIPYRAAD